MGETLRRIGRRELAQATGREGAPAWVAYEGVVYDTSSSYQWRQGRHQVTHAAGEDYSGRLGDAPHGPELLARLPVVGVLVEGE